MNNFQCNPADDYILLVDIDYVLNVTYSVPRDKSDVAKLLVLSHKLSQIKKKIWYKSKKIEANIQILESEDWELLACMLKF